MKKFKKAYLPKITPEQIVKQFNISIEEARKHLEFMDTQEVYLNDLYQVNIDKNCNSDFVWLSIKRIDKEPVTDWRHKQIIKNEFVGKENEAVELYPAESRLVDTANQYHLWVAKDAKYRFPFGFNQRKVEKIPGGNAKQRKFKL